MFLSDNQIANVFTTVINDLQKHDLQNKITPQIAQGLQETFNQKLHNNTFGQLTQDEKNEAYKIFSTCLSAAPGWIDLPHTVQQQIIPINLIVINSHQSKHHHHHHHRHGLEPIDWMILGAALGHHHHHHHGLFCCGGRKSSKEDTNKALLAIVLFLLALIILVLAMLALYFLLTSLLDCSERFCWREGRAQAFIQLTTTLAAGVGAGMLGSMLLVSPMASFALLLGLSNPIGLLIGGSILLGIAAAALTGLITKVIQNKVIASMHTDAMDTNDPFRYALTPGEIQHLEKHDFDCMAVKCAIVSLRAQLGQEGMPSYFFRPFTKNMDQRHSILKQIRQLRRGQLEEITINSHGDMPALTFKLKIERISPFNPEVLNNQSHEPQFPEQYPPHIPHVYVQHNSNSFQFFENNQQPVTPFNPQNAVNNQSMAQPFYSDNTAMTQNPPWNPNSIYNQLPLNYTGNNLQYY